MKTANMYYSQHPIQTENELTENTVPEIGKFLLLKYFRRYAEKRKLNAQKIKICAIYVVERLSDEIFLTQKLKMQIIFNMKISRSTVYNLASLSGSCAGE